MTPRTRRSAIQQTQTPKRIIKELIQNYEKAGKRDIDMAMGCYLQAMAVPGHHGKFLLVKLVGREPVKY